MPPSLGRYSAIAGTHLPNSPSSIIALFKSCKTLLHLHQLHASIILNGFEQHHVLITQFISKANSIGYLAYSATVFDRVVSPNTYLWNAIIGGYCDRSHFLDTFSLFMRMKREGGRPDRFTYPSLVKACAGEGRVTEGRAIHGSAIRCGVDGDMFVTTSLIDLYGKGKEIACARKVFDGMQERNVVSWTAMVVGYVSVWDLAQAKRLFDQMPQRNIASWNAIIRGFVQLGDMSTARKIFDEMPERNVVSFTTMIDGYAKAGEMHSARLLFGQTPEKDIVAWSALISGYVQNGQPNEAVKVFLGMESMNVKPDEFVMVSLMSACSQLGSLDLAKWVDSHVSRRFIDVNGGHVLAALIDMNAKCGNIDRATDLFEGMRRRDVISYCSMIQGLSVHGQGPQAVALFRRMLDEGLTPDVVAFTVILTACSRAGLVDEGQRFFELMKNEYSIVPTPDHYSCIVDLLSRSGRLAAAYSVLQSMPGEPHACAWGALLGACNLYHDVELGEVVARRLFKIEPQNPGNYVQLSNIYASEERWSDVSLVRKRMKKRRVRKIPGCSRIDLIR